MTVLIIENADGKYAVDLRSDISLAGKQPDFIFESFEKAKMWVECVSTDIVQHKIPE